MATSFHSQPPEARRKSVSAETETEETEEAVAADRPEMGGGWREEEEAGTFAEDVGEGGRGLDEEGPELVLRERPPADLHHFRDAHRDPRHRDEREDASVSSQISLLPPHRLSM